MRERTRSRALVIGGGIAGLSAAIALQQAGIEVSIFESASTMREVGAGLTLWTNAVRALQKLGLTEALRAIGLASTQATIRSWQGEILSETPVTELANRFGVASLVGVHRADVQAMLLGALGKEVVHPGARCVGCAQDEAGVRAYFADGQEVRGDILIGADGLHSVIRASLFDQEKPRYAGYTAWRGVTLFEQKEKVFESWGSGRRFGFVPLTQGRVYWFATTNAPEGRADGVMGRKHALFNLFRGWHEPVEAVIEATEEEAVLRNDIYDLKPFREWGKGRITLLGDAAHATTPNLGQGAGLAIEDALVLAACLQNATEMSAALRAYEQRRIKRANAIIKRSWELGRVAQWENPVACTVRNAMLKRVPSSLLLKQLEQVLGYEV